MDGTVNFWLCDHLDELACQRVLSTGLIQYGYQCERCGKWRAVKKSEFAVESSDTLPQYRESIREAFHESALRKSRIDSELRRTEQREEWFKWYNTYLQTDEWKAKRARVLERDKFLYQACLRRTASQVHHLTYQNVGREPLFELTSVCDVCHDAIHDKAG